MAKRKKKSSINLFLFIISVLAAIAAIIFYFSRTRFVRYAAFGIDVPVSYSIHGIDVSHHQSSIDWEDVKAMQIKNIKIGFAFIKATEGINDEDSRFDENWNDAKDAAIPRGAYHFFNAGKSGKAQAENFIETVKLVKGDLPPVLDVEHVNGASKADLQQRVSDWLVMVEAHYHVKPIIYTGADFYTNFLAGRFDDYPLWVAHYLEKDRPRVKRNWTFWQHNEAGHVNGIDAFVDFNVFNGDSTDFKNLMIK